MQKEHLVNEEIIANLEAEWDEPDGFFWRLRQGDFDPVGASRYESVLKSHAREIRGLKLLDRRVVELLWFGPIFMMWQRERVSERGGSASSVELAANRIADILLADVLGGP